MCAASQPTIGFDFGTSTTLVSSARDVVPIGLGEVREWMPSLVGYDYDGALQVAEKAEALDEEQRVRSIKRAITENRETVDVSVLPRGASADDLIVELLREAARRASRQGQDLSGGTPLRLGCPAIWDGHQRRRLLRAAQRANIPVLFATMVDEPVAAGIAWLAKQTSESHRPLRIVVFDMGGGTLDIAVLEARHKEIFVLAALGSVEAGDALDEAIAIDLETELNSRGIYLDDFAAPSVGERDEKRARRARRWLRDQARIAKENLSDDEEHVIVLREDLIGGTGEIWFARGRLNDVFLPLMDRAVEAVDLALRIARLAQSAEPDQIAVVPTQTLTRDIDVVLLSGGMCRAKYVTERLRHMFHPGTTIEFATNQPEQAVAIGLAKAANYESINVFRPAFDILLEWDEGREYRTIYDAFTPIAGNAKIAGPGDRLRYVSRAPALSLPPEGNGHIRVLSHSGEPVRATLEGRALDGYAVSFTDVVFTFSIFPDGRIRLIDKNGVADGVIEWHRIGPGREPTLGSAQAGDSPVATPPRDSAQSPQSHANTPRQRPDRADDVVWMGEDDNLDRLDDLIEQSDAFGEIDAISFAQLQDQVQQILETLSEREAGVVRLRFGLADGQPRTLDEIAKVYGVTRERIRKIERKAMSKLRHPSRTEMLRDYFD